MTNLSKTALGLGAAAALAAIVFVASNGDETGPRYVVFRDCALSADGGLAPLTIPEGLTVVAEDLAADGGAEGCRLVTALAAPGSLEPPELEPECACSSGSNCEVLLDSPFASGWASAPNGVTLAAGRWRGGGCVRKPCVELAGGLSSRPDECPAQ